MIMRIYIILLIIGIFIDDYIRYIILVNVIIIVGLWIGDYMHLSRIAKELNGRRVNIRVYRKRYSAIVKINKILYRIEIGYYYGIVGNVVYTLKITEL